MRDPAFSRVSNRDSVSMDEVDSVDEDDPELSCFCLVSSGGGTFHVSVLMQRVLLLTEASAGMPSRPAMIFVVHPGVHLGIC